LLPVLFGLLLGHLLHLFHCQVMLVTTGGLFALSGELAVPFYSTSLGFLDAIGLVAFNVGSSAFVVCMGCCILSVSKAQFSLM